MDRGSLIFCSGSLAVCIGLALVGFPYAALDRDVVEMAKSPQLAEIMPMVEVGGGFGEVSALALIDYYIDNPPVVSLAAAAPAPEVRLGGC